MYLLLFIEFISDPYQRLKVFLILHQKVKSDNHRDVMLRNVNDGHL